MSVVQATTTSDQGTNEPTDALRAYWLTNFLAPYGDIHLERIRAHASHSGTGLSLEQMPADADAWLTALTEKVRSRTRTLCDRQRPIEPRDDLVQVAAVACAWIASIDRAGDP